MYMYLLCYRLVNPGVSELNPRGAKTYQVETSQERCFPPVRTENPGPRGPHGIKPLTTFYSSRTAQCNSRVVLTTWILGSTPRFDSNPFLWLHPKTGGFSYLVTLNLLRMRVYLPSLCCFCNSHPHHLCLGILFGFDSGLHFGCFIALSEFGPKTCLRFNNGQIQFDAFAGDGVQVLTPLHGPSAWSFASSLRIIADGEVINMF